MRYTVSETQPTTPLTGDIWEKASNHAQKYYNGTEWKPLNIFPVYIELQPDLDWETVRATGKPTWVTRGVFGGFSLPIYNNDNEELFLIICVPDRYDGESDILVHVDCWLSLAEDSKNFKLQVSWEYHTPGEDAVPATTHDVEVQTATGALAAQFQSYHVEFVIDYDAHDPDNITFDDILGIRLRRIAAAADEIGGEIVVCHVGVVYQRDKLGVESP